MDPGDGRVEDGVGQGRGSQCRGSECTYELAGGQAPLQQGRPLLDSFRRGITPKLVNPLLYSPKALQDLPLGFEQPARLKMGIRLRAQ